MPESDYVKQIEVHVVIDMDTSLKSEELEELPVIRNEIYKAIEAGNLTTEKDRNDTGIMVSKLSPFGTKIIVILREGLLRLSIHPEKKTVILDVISSGPETSAYTVASYLINFFQTEKVNQRVIRRGIPLR